jgi:hypothetical protein
VLNVLVVPSVAMRGRDQRPAAPRCGAGPVQRASSDAMRSCASAQGLHDLARHGLAPFGGLVGILDGLSGLLLATDNRSRQVVAK